MRRVRLETPVPEVRREEFRTHAALDVARLVPLHGGTWRAVEMTGTYQSITARYALAHELPTCDDRPAPRTGVTRGEAA